MPPFARYCIAWLASLVATLGLIAAFNALIDPYAVFGTPRIAGLNQAKLTAQSHAGLSKPYQAERVHPHAVLIGASTVDLGLDPANPIWPEELRPVFNFGVPGSDPQYQFRSLQHAVAAGPVKAAVIVVSFVDALYAAPTPTHAYEPSEAERRLFETRDGAVNQARMQQTLRDAFFSTLTLGALSDSVTTVLWQRAADVADLTELGSTTEGAFRRTAAAEGYASLFRTKGEEYARRLNQLALTPNSQSDRQFWLDTIGAMVEFCLAHQIRPIVVIAPYHADLLEIIDRAGLWDAFEQWKIDLVARIGRSGAAASVVWDFTNYDEFSTEEVPKKRGPASSMQWFWEPVHFKKALGNKVLQRILTDQPAEFGVAITPENVRSHLADIRAARQAYREQKRRGHSHLSEAFPAVSR